MKRILPFLTFVFLCNVLCIAQNVMRIDVDYIKSLSELEGYQSNELDVFNNLEKRILEEPIIIPEKNKEKYFYMHKSSSVRLDGKRIYASNSFENTSDKVLVTCYDSGEISLLYINGNQVSHISKSIDGKLEIIETLMNNEENIETECGNHHSEKNKNNESTLSRASSSCGATEYEVEIGVGVDFAYVTTVASGNVAMANALVTSYFLSAPGVNIGVAERYEDCGMRIIPILVDMVTESSLEQFFAVPPLCAEPMADNSVDAYRYNINFMLSPSRPNGDVISLITGFGLSGVGCFREIAGMAFGFGGVCSSAGGYQKSNVLEGTGGVAFVSELWTHEIGHNLGYGSFFDQHPSVNPGTFYHPNLEPLDPHLWSASTVIDIHDNLDYQECIDKIQYCCINQRDVHICGDDFSFDLDSEFCQGDLSMFSSHKVELVGNTISGTFGGNSHHPVTITQSTSVLGCDFNSIHFNIISYDKDNFSVYDQIDVRQKICIGRPKKCFDFPCVTSWEIGSLSQDIEVTSENGILCFKSPFGSREGNVNIRLRPTLRCGEVGNWLNLVVKLEDCRKDEEDDGGGHELDDDLDNDTDLRSTDINRNVEIYPMPFKDQLSLTSTANIKKVEFLDSTGKLISVYMNTASDDKITLNVADIHSGIMFLRLQYLDGSIDVKKVVKVE